MYEFRYNFDEILNKVINKKLASYVKFTYKDKRNTMEFKFQEGITISFDIDLFGYGALQKYTNTYTNFYDERTDFIINRMKEDPKFKLKVEDLSIFPNSCAVILFEDDPVFDYYNMKIWCGIKRTEYECSGNDIEAMYDRFMRVIKRYSSTNPGHIYFIDARKKPKYEDLKYYI